MKKTLWVSSIIGSIVVATMIPGGIFIDEKIKINKLIKSSDKSVEKMQKKIFSQELSLLKSTDEEDIWKLSWIKKIFSWWKNKQKEKPLAFTKEEMEEAQKEYWDEIVIKTKWNKIVKTLNEEDWTKIKNLKKEYWDRARDLCYIFNSKGDRSNDISLDESTQICAYYKSTKPIVTDTFKNSNEKKKNMEFMEYFWTVFRKKEFQKPNK